jgi:hypothetical protein
MSKRMPTLLASMAVTFNSMSLWDGPMTARAQLNRGTEGLTALLSRPDLLFARCYRRDQRQLHRAERGT